MFALLLGTSGTKLCKTLLLSLILDFLSRFCKMPPCRGSEAGACLLWGRTPPGLIPTCGQDLDLEVTRNIVLNKIVLVQNITYADTIVPR